MLGYFTITRDTYFDAAVATGRQLPLRDRSTRATTSTTVIERVDAVTEEVPGLQVLDRDGFIDSIVDQIAFMLQFITIVLGLSVIIALIGVVEHPQPLDQRAHPRARPAARRRHGPDGSSSDRSDGRR